jgi:hypothetical protein
MQYGLAPPPAYGAAAAGPAWGYPAAASTVPSQNNALPPPYAAAVSSPVMASPPINVTSPRQRRKVNEIKLYETARERAVFEELSDLYSIIRATEALETAYSRDAISKSEYGEACSKLITQFKGTEAGLIQGGKILNIDQFFKDYSVDCPRAYERLVKVGVPVTVMHASHDERQEGIDIFNLFYLNHDGIYIRRYSCRNGSVLHYSNGCFEA